MQRCEHIQDRFDSVKRVRLNIPMNVCLVVYQSNRKLEEAHALMHDGFDATSQLLQPPEVYCAYILLFLIFIALDEIIFLNIGFFHNIYQVFS